ncbi:hypothetical protein GJAV_G00125230 [Gymnothorax javanicus]|nr:hypothetical protein GJAV_G00125230 [Gymnothorax javanicus]
MRRQHTELDHREGEETLNLQTGVNGVQPPAQDALCCSKSTQVRPADPQAKIRIESSTDRAFNVGAQRNGTGQSDRSRIELARGCVQSIKTRRFGCGRVRKKELSSSSETSTWQNLGRPT